MSDRNYVILADSGSDITPEKAKEWGIGLIPLIYTVEGSDPCPGDKCDIKEFYSQMRSGKTVTTAAANIEDLTEAIEPYVAGGTDIVYIAFSSGLSSTAQTACIVCRELSEKYPERRILTVDSLSASLGYGLLVYLASRRRDEGADIDGIVEFVENTRGRLCHWFTVDDLFHLKRGGRVSAATAVVGTMLSIKPILHVDDAGHLVSVDKARGRKASLAALVERMKRTAVDPEHQTVFISHGDSPEDAAAVEKAVREAMAVTDIYTGYIGPVIGAHSGPGTVALFFIGTER